MQFMHILYNSYAKYYRNLGHLWYLWDANVCLSTTIRMSNRLFTHVPPMYNFCMTCTPHISCSSYVIDALITKELHIKSAMIMHGSCMIAVLCDRYRPVNQLTFNPSHTEWRSPHFDFRDVVKPYFSSVWWFNLKHLYLKWYFRRGESLGRMTVTSYHELVFDPFVGLQFGGFLRSRAKPRVEAGQVCCRRDEASPEKHRSLLFCLGAQRRRHYSNRVNLEGRVGASPMLLRRHGNY